MRACEALGEECVARFAYDSSNPPATGRDAKINGAARASQRRRRMNPANDPRSPRILAKTLVRDLREQGWDARALITLANELLGQIAADVRARRAEASRP